MTGVYDAIIFRGLPVGFGECSKLNLNPFFPKFAGAFKAMNFLQESMMVTLPKFNIAPEKLPSQ